MYKNETDKPSEPSKGAKPSGQGCDDFKGQAMDIAFGQAGKSGCKSDQSKAKSQMKQYGWSE